MTLHEVAKLLGASLEEGTPDLEISGVASLMEARPGDLTFFGNPRYLVQLRVSAASAAIVPLDCQEQVAPVLLRVENPSLAFATVVASFAPAEIVPAAGIHPSAIVSPDARLGEGISIGALVVIEAGAVIGDGSILHSGCVIGHEVRLGSHCLLHANVTIRERCVLGDRVILQPGAVIGSCGFGYELQEGRHQKIPQTGIVEIGDDVEIGANTTIDRARFGRTVIGAGTKIDNLVQIAHNVQVGSNTIICSQVGIAGSTRVGSFVTLAGQVGLAGHLNVGDRATITAQAGLNKDVPAGAVLAGHHALPIRESLKLEALTRKLPELVERLKALEEKLDGQPPA